MSDSTISTAARDERDAQINDAQDALRAAQRVVCGLILARATDTLRAGRPEGGVLYTRDVYEDGEHDILLVRLDDRAGTTVTTADGSEEVYDILPRHIFDAARDDLLTLWWAGFGWRHGEESITF